MATFKLLCASGANPATVLPATLIATSVNEARPNPVVEIVYETVPTLPSGDVVEFTGASGQPAVGIEAVVKELRVTFPFLTGKDKAKEELWLSRINEYTPLDFKALEAPLQRLDSYLVLRSFLVGYTLSAPDIAIWGAIRGNRVAVAAVRKGTLIHLTRWFRFLEELCSWTAAAVDDINAAAKAKKAARSKAGASYDIALLNTDKGVMTRFPPEPSGYLHIGHAKAALLNDYFAHEKYNGTMLLRFDDTNPSKEKEEYHDAILEDLALMGIKPDKVSYSSDYFQLLHDYCIQMIKDGNAYADDTDKETMAHERMHGIPSKRRDASVEDNLKHFEEMKSGSEEGQKWCIRAKISPDDKNKAMRDPVIYRCQQIPHPRTGTTWKVYPTYDFTCPILDSVEGISHALRTIEYRDRNPQYEWMLNALKLRNVQIWDFARMNFVRTLLSKRKLTKLVDSGAVWGWDDPRFPTIRGIRRRGMTIPALREFILKQGPSRNIINLDWTIFWSTNKKHIDPVSARHTAILKEGLVKATVKGAPAPYVEDRPKHNKNPEVGTKKVAFSDSIILEQEDAKSFKQDEEITLMAWGNAYVRKIEKSGDVVTHLELELHLEGDVKKTDKKVTWLSTEAQQLVPVELVGFDHLLTKDSLQEEDNFEDFLNPKTEWREDALADGNVASLKQGEIIQFERKTYYRCDRPFADDGKPAVFFEIPTGKTAK
ncbi:glutamyl-tRNA synthetase [Talaromyces proteolyticus]|uniref:glutamate--tRNA ligase n=1 Tax=Talaromyces proteolyticus TaxID=1131652 RepID=A0AAD4L109_9EURO|nr:glutamyl-tRNA synthetase [Talaromyces proteolyticus]KAH8702161.1 glutamyl-tRNA synthetase [Talaromyces proteolyticus]